MSKTKQPPHGEELAEEVIVEASTATDSPVSEEAKSEWQQKAEEYLDDLKRVQADFENYKKRMKQEERELYGHLTSQIVAELIPVLDNLHAASEHVPAESKNSPWVTGITYIEKQFEEVLRSHGVEPIDVKPGDPFDPSRHEALDHKATEGETDQPLKIEKVIQKGYQIKDKLVRPAKVVVS